MKNANEKKLGKWNQFPTYDGIIIAQTLDALNSLDSIIKDFDTIIEIGYDRGGLTQWFFDHKKNDSKVITFDISDESRLSQNYSFSPEIEFNVENCFSEWSINKIRNKIKMGGRVLLFCDGGDKDKEFNTFCKYLKANDVIMVHDYFDERSGNPYGFYADGWDSNYESSYNNISHSIETEMLKGFYYENFEKCLIGSFIKER